MLRCAALSLATLSGAPDAGTRSPFRRPWYALLGVRLRRPGSQEEGEDVNADCALLALPNEIIRLVLSRASGCKRSCRCLPRGGVTKTTRDRRAHPTNLGRSSPRTPWHGPRARASTCAS